MGTPLIEVFSDQLDTTMQYTALATRTDLDYNRTTPDLEMTVHSGASKSARRDLQKRLQAIADTLGHSYQWIFRIDRDGRTMRGMPRISPSE